MLGVNGDAIIPVHKPSVEELPVPVLVVQNEQDWRLVPVNRATEVGRSHGAIVEDLVCASAREMLHEPAASHAGRIIGVEAATGRRSRCRTRLRSRYPA